MWLLHLGRKQDNPTIEQTCIFAAPTSKARTLSNPFSLISPHPFLPSPLQFPFALQLEQTKTFRNKRWIFSLIFQSKYVEREGSGIQPGGKIYHFKSRRTINVDRRYVYAPARSPSAANAHTLYKFRFVDDLVSMWMQRVRPFRMLSNLCSLKIHYSLLLFYRS